jgi:hypothetical protein
VKCYRNRPSLQVRATLNFHILFICKTNDSASQRRVIVASPTTPRRRMLPSYTWVGWRRTIYWFEEFLTLSSEQSSESGSWFTNWLEQCTWIKFYILDPSGISEEAWFFTKQQEKSRDYPDYHISSLKTSPPPLKLSSLVTKPTMAPRDIRRAYPMLHFWTMTARYTIIATDEPYRVDLHSRDRQFCGEVYLDDLLDRDTTKLQEFLILSKAKRAPESKISEPARRVWGHSIVEVNTNRDWADWNSFFVMIIKRVADSVAERRGIGWVLQSSLDFCYDPGPKWEEVMLG